MWMIKQIAEADFGCEERAENEPLKVLVNLEADDGRNIWIEVSDEKLKEMDLNEGDEWPENIQ